MESDMSATGLEVFDKTVQTTNKWLKEINAEIGPDRHLAWHVLGCVLRRLRDRLTPELAAHLAAELPLLVRGTYYQEYRPAIQPVVVRSRDQFLELVSTCLANTRPVKPEAAVRAVCGVLSRHLPAGEVAEARQALPEHIRELWPTPEEAVLPTESVEAGTKAS
jgi:uncharacterized protein (DUF2267 family)